MKRPMATVGFSMLIVSLLVTNISFKSSVALLIGATVVFCLFIAFKKLRKYKFVIFSVFAVMIYIVSFIFTQSIYINAENKHENKVKISGVVCQTPQETDYAYTYVIKLDNKNYKIRYVSEDNKMFNEGDVVSGFVTAGEEQFKDAFFENSLSSKIYFTFFESEDAFLDKTGEINDFYASLGKIKIWFTNIVDTYIPGESGAIAKAMTIGDKSEISDKTITHFNYAGTSHLLVISGLHLTLWSIGIMRFVEKFSKLRKYTAFIGLVCLVLYSALTGFSVSVIRAGAMVGAVLLGKVLHRDADSINSIGTALALILTLNPYATLSTALWFTVLSTLGILVLSQRIVLWIKEYEKGKRIAGNGLIVSLITTTVISISTTIFTLPVFIVKFEIVPIASFISNIVMVDLSLVLMVLTVVGAVFHSIGFTILAEVFFTITGAISDFLKVFAEKIGLAEWSTVSIYHKYFTYFLVLALASVFVAYMIKKYRKTLLKSVAVILATIFVLLTTYCTAYDYHTPSIDIVFTDSVPLLIVNSKGESVLVNPPTTKYENDIMRILNAHNEKIVDNILITENTDYTPSYLIDFYSRFNVKNTLFCYQAPKVFENHSQSNVKALTVGGNVKINAEKYMEYIEMTCNNKQLILIDSENAENLFKKVKDYDIIILYGKKAVEVRQSIETANSYAQVFVSQGEQVDSIYFN